MRSQKTIYFTAEEYFTLIRRATYKSEYIKGGIFAIVNETKPHHLIVGNTYASIHQQLETGFVYALNMQVQVTPSGLHTYPDIVITGDEERFLDEYQDTLLNPKVIIEVCSKSTESYDRGEKFDWYCQFEDLKEYLLIYQNKVLIEHAIRQENEEWLWIQINDLQDTVPLYTIDCELTLTEVYNKVF
jgi:Uma2 family endonuclease